eukprot:83334-Rhodomonas_salina.1
MRSADISRGSWDIDSASDPDTTECDTVAGSDAKQHTETSSNADFTDSTAHGFNNVLGPHQRSFPQPDTVLDWEEIATLLSTSSRTEWRGKRLFVGSTEAK